MPGDVRLHYNTLPYGNCQERYKIHSNTTKEREYTPLLRPTGHAGAPTRVRARLPDQTDIDAVEYLGEYVV